MALLNIHQDHLPLAFGKYEGLTPEKISEEDPEYIVWLYENVEPKRCSEALYRDCKNGLDEDPVLRELTPGEVQDWFFNKGQ